MSNQNKKNDIETIIEEIGKLSDLDLTESNLKPEIYALPNGWADKIAKELQKQNLKTAQLRKFFNEIKVIQRTAKSQDINYLKAELIKIIPQLVFAKNRGVIKNDFYDLLITCLLNENKNDIRFKSYEEFNNVVSFLEAIVAYHKE